jgi:hypothetical protein
MMNSAEICDADIPASANSSAYRGYSGTASASAHHATARRASRVASSGDRREDHHGGCIPPLYHPAVPVPHRSRVARH